MYATVLIDAVIGNEDKFFDYIIPKQYIDRVRPGVRVFVPFGPRQVEGFVLGIKPETEVDPAKLKQITKVPDEFVAIKEEFLGIADELCDKFKLKKIDVLRLFVPSTVRVRKRVRKVENREIKARKSTENEKVILTEQQQKAADTIITSTETFVLHGVTGSGKTQVYMNVIERVLDAGKTAIMLVPEIGLTPQVLSSFRERFGDTVAMIHSGLSQTERYDQWLRLHTGEARIVIGARSGIFAPLEGLGVIIIDEEHDGSYFSESNPRFHTHAVAALRARYNKCPLVLGSATPSLETMSSNHRVLKLDRRVKDLSMPIITVINMAAEIRGGNGGMFARETLAALAQTIESGRQAVVFLNRRGFSSHVMCKNCGWVARCDNCDVSLVFHKDDGMLKCHYCQARFSQVHKCPECNSTYLKFGSTGTQKVVEELCRLFPNTKIFRMDADNTKTKDALVNILDDFAASPGSVLVGTQMIAKGHHFPLVDLVCVVDADNSLHFSDYRAAERTFALITQVAGRAGRDSNAGRVFVQTYVPGHYIYRLAANYDYDRFLEKELNTRQVTKYPPFTTIVRVLVTGQVDATIKSVLKDIMERLRGGGRDFVYLGAMKSPLGRIQNKFRYQILARFAKEDEAQTLAFMHQTISQAKVPKSIQIFFEINPQNLA